MEKLKNKNGFLVTCISCIALLLLMCYFGINTRTKATYSASTYTCPDGYEGPFKLNGTDICYPSGADVKAIETGSANCEVPVLKGEHYIYNQSNYNCTIKGNDLNTYYCSKNNITAPDGLCIVNADEETYTVTLNKNDGSGSTYTVQCIRGKSCTLNNPFNRDGYTFTGWKDESGFSYTSAITSSTGQDKTLYAQWDKIEEVQSYTVTIYGNEGNPSSQIIQCPQGDKCNTAGFAEPTRTGYELSGFATNPTEASCNTAIPVTTLKNYLNSEGAVDSDEDYYACWRNLGTPKVYKITYMANGGTGSMYHTDCTQGSSCTLRTNSFTRNNYIFKGWGKSATSTTVEYTDGQTITLNDNLTLYAIWDTASGGNQQGGTFTPQTFTATFDANGGTLNGDSSKTCNTTSTTASCSIEGLPSATKDGHTFNGWGLNSSCTSGEKSEVVLYGNSTYYACYTKNGTNSDENVTKNPPTGEIAIALAWFVGLFAIGYMLHYFKSIKEN